MAASSTCTPSFFARLVVVAELSAAAIGCAGTTENMEDVAVAIDPVERDVETSQTREHILLAAAPREGETAPTGSASTVLSAGDSGGTKKCVAKNVGGHWVLECTECTSGPGGTTTCTTKLCDPSSGKCTS